MNNWVSKVGSVTDTNSLGIMRKRGSTLGFEGKAKLKQNDTLYYSIILIKT